MKFKKNHIAQWLIVWMFVFFCSLSLSLSSASLEQLFANYENVCYERLGKLDVCKRCYMRLHVDFFIGKIALKRWIQFIYLIDIILCNNTFAWIASKQNKIVYSLVVQTAKLLFKLLSHLFYCYFMLNINVNLISKFITL